MLNKILSIAMCLAFFSVTTISTEIADAKPHHKHLKKHYKKKHHVKRFHGLKHKHRHRRNKAGKIIGTAIGLGILGAALADQHRYEESYHYDDEIDDRENAVGICVHRGSRLVHKAGGDHMRLNRVKSVRTKPNGRIVVNAVMTGYYNFGPKTSHVRCVVKNHRIISFRY